MFVYILFCLCFAAAVSQILSACKLLVVLDEFSQSHSTSALALIIKRRRFRYYVTHRVSSKQVFLTKGGSEFCKIYLLTPRSRVLLGKLTVSQLVKKFLTFYGIRRLITAFTSAPHLSLS